ncbi:PucR family transcriptional regulator [Streptomyces roseolilacinus]|uniref:Transcriptional regulator n=1 Tax=Streptomyces roseolilacinus TaxID=66904 RepID=A0A918B616_9ACTN|nr:helix-turn-helix domain-containing protein [Streptomyces roseolilacinus]GGQ33561.1 transcriptional regulator [Streptomyces roseolilacinus]
MSTYNSGGIVIGGEEVERYLLKSSHRLQKTVVEQLCVQLPVYGKLPTEQLEGDVARMVRRGIDDFARALSTGRMPGPEQLALLSSSAARRAEEGLPAEAVVAAYFLGARLCVDEVASKAGPEDLMALTALHRLILEYLQLVTTAVTAGYVQRMQTTAGERHSAQQLMFNALLEGRAESVAAGEARFVLPPGYLVLALSLAPHPDEQAPDVDNTVAAQRKLRRVRTELDLHTRGAALTSITGDGGLVLLPCESAPDGLTPAYWDNTTQLLARLERAAGGAIHAAAVPALPGDVPEACPLATELTRIATTSARPPGLYRLQDLALEYQLSRPGPARDHMARLLEPLGGHSDLLLTLSAFLRHGADRRLTARSLNLHPNTVLYRLRKITDLTGLDATRPADVPTLHAALTCRTLVHPMT